MDTTAGEVSTEALRRDIAEQRDDIGRDLTAIGDRVSPGRVADRSKERARRRMGEWKDRVMGSAEDVKTTIGSSSGPSSPSASTRIRETAGSAGDSVVDTVEGRPVVAGLVAFGIGFIAGSVLPASRPERDLARKVEPQLESLAEGVGGTAREAAENLRPVVEDEVSAMTDEAKAAASSAAAAARDEAEAAKQDVRNTG